MQGFKGKKLNEVKKIIEQDLSFRRSQQKDRTKEKDEEDKIIDKKRAFLNYMKPPFCWNFFTDDEEEKEEGVPHVLRAEAEPQKPRDAGRVSQPPTHSARPRQSASHRARGPRGIPATPISAGLAAARQLGREG